MLEEVVIVAPCDSIGNSQKLQFTPGRTQEQKICSLHWPSLHQSRISKPNHFTQKHSTLTLHVDEMNWCCFISLFVCFVGYLLREKKMGVEFGVNKSSEKIRKDTRVSTRVMQYNWELTMNSRLYSKPKCTVTHIYMAIWFSSSGLSNPDVEIEKKIFLQNWYINESLHGDTSLETSKKEQGI